MMFEMPQYEVRDFGTTEWEVISEIQLMQMLHKYFDRVAPAIQQMIEGGQVITADAVYRLKRRDDLKIYSDDPSSGDRPGVLQNIFQGIRRMRVIDDRGERLSPVHLFKPARYPLHR